MKKMERIIETSNMETKAKNLVSLFYQNERVADAMLKINLPWCCAAYNNYVIERNDKNLFALRKAYEMNGKTILFINFQMFKETGKWLLSKNPNPEKLKYSDRVQQMSLEELDEIIEEYRQIDWKVKVKFEEDSYTNVSYCM